MSLCVDDLLVCITEGHLHRVTYTGCHIDTTNSPDDGHMAVRNVWRIEINIHEKKNCASCWLFTKINPSAWGHLNPSSYCDVGRLFYEVFKLWSKLQRKK